MRLADGAKRVHAISHALGSPLDGWRVPWSDWFHRYPDRAVKTRARRHSSLELAASFLVDTEPIDGFDSETGCPRLGRRGMAAGLLLGMSLCLAAWAGGAASAGVPTTHIATASARSNLAAASTSTSTTSATEPLSKSYLRTEASAWAQQLAADSDLTTCRLAIPKIELDLAVIEMTSESLLDIGPGHWPETPLPGMDGQFVISGHRTLHGGPFRRLDELDAGDVILVTLPYAQVRYEVTRTLIVGWNDTQVVQSRGLEELSLTTCHPPGRADQVMVVQAQAMDFRQVDD